MTRLPSALFVVDIVKEGIAVKEAKRLGIPVFGLVDTNSNPNEVDFSIPANDDAAKSIEIIVAALCESIKEGFEERKIEKADANAAEAQEGNEDEAPRERKAKAKKERVAKEDEEAINAAVAGKFIKEDEE
jgi:small subunit ribosomal protein S2